MKNIYGIKYTSDRKAEEDIYTVGSDGNIPIVLFALIASNHKNAVERYLSVYSDTDAAKDYTKMLYSNNAKIKKEIEKIVEFFDERDPESQQRIIDHWKKNGGIPIFKGFEKTNNRPINEIIENYPRDTILNFSIYASQLATYMALLTPKYDTGYEGSPQACSMSYIAFYERKEFKEANNAIDNAFSYLVGEIVRIMKLRNIEVDEKSMTLSMPSYKAISFRKDMYPGF